MMKRHWFWGLLFTLIVVASALWLWGKRKTEGLFVGDTSPPSPSPSRPAGVGEETHKHEGEHKGENREGVLVLAPETVKELGIKTLHVQRRSFPLSLTTTGIVLANDDRIVQVTPLVAGKIQRLYVRVGDRVRKGQPLAAIYSIELANALRSVREAKARLELAQKNLDYIRRLVEAGAFTQPSLEEARNFKAQAESELKAAQAALETAKKQLDWAKAELERTKKLAKVGEFHILPFERAQDRYAEAVQKLKSAQAELKFARQNEKRLERLYKEGVASLRALQEAQAFRRRAEAAVARAEIEVRVTKSMLERERDIMQAGVRVSKEVQEAQTRYFEALRAYDAAKARLTRAEEQLRVAKQRLRREETIYRQGIWALKELRKAETEYEAAKITYETALHALKVLGGHPDQKEAISLLRAPISGLIIERPVNRGQAVTPETLIAKVLDLTTVWVDADVFEKDLAKVRRGQEVQVYSVAFPDQPFTGRVYYISGEVDERTRTVKVRTEIWNPQGKLRPGMFVTVTLKVGQVNALAIPEEAILTVGEEKVVFVREDERTFVKRPVKVGRVADGWAEIVGGLRGGEEVVVQGAFDLKSTLLREEIGEGHGH